MSEYSTNITPILILLAYASNPKHYDEAWLSLRINGMFRETFSNFFLDSTDLLEIKKKI